MRPGQGPGGGQRGLSSVPPRGPLPPRAEATTHTAKGNQALEGIKAIRVLTVRCSFEVSEIKPFWFFSGVFHRIKIYPKEMVLS